MYTLVGEPIKLFVKNIVEVRNTGVLEKQNMALEIDDDIRKAFERSTFVSCKLSKFSVGPLRRGAGLLQPALEL